MVPVMFNAFHCILLHVSKAFCMRCRLFCYFKACDQGFLFGVDTWEAHGGHMACHVPPVPRSGHMGGTWWAHGLPCACPGPRSSGAKGIVKDKRETATCPSSCGHVNFDVEIMITPFPGACSTFPSSCGHTLFMMEFAL